MGFDPLNATGEPLNASDNVRHRCSIGLRFEQTHRACRWPLDALDSAALARVSACDEQVFLVWRKIHSSDL
jgi:hypothetical protein